MKRKSTKTVEKKKLKQTEPLQVVMNTNAYMEWRRRVLHHLGITLPEGQ